MTVVLLGTLLGGLAAAGTVIGASAAVSELVGTKISATPWALAGALVALAVRWWWWWAPYLPELAGDDPDLSAITIGHLLSMSSGLAFEEMRWVLFNGDDPLTTCWYGYFWYGRERANADPDFFAEGDHGQFIYVSPSTGNVVVRMGTDLGIPCAEWIDAFYLLCSESAS